MAIDLMMSKKTVVVVCGFLGSLLLIIACYLFLQEFLFVSRSAAFEGTIVEIQNEYVRKGKGSVPAFVPIIEINSSSNSKRVKVDTSSEEPQYSLGERLAVVCDSSFLQCKPNTFMSKWGGSVADFLLSLLFFSVVVVYYTRAARKDNEHPLSVIDQLKPNTQNRKQ